MSEHTIRRCDNPTCRVEIPDNARTYEMRFVLVLYRPGAKPTEAYLRRELCGHACLLASTSALIREVDALPADPAPLVTS